MKKKLDLQKNKEIEGHSYYKDISRWCIQGSWSSSRKISSEKTYVRDELRESENGFAGKVGADGFFRNGVTPGSSTKKKVGGDPSGGHRR